MTLSARLTGLSTIALALGFNIPFAILGATFEYPDILRRPAAEVLTAFHAGGASLVLTWYAFMLSALLMVPVATAIATALPATRSTPVLRQVAITAGSAAGLLQAVGLSRWVFAVPDLARVQIDAAASDTAKSASQSAFDLLNHWGGVAIGEHLGQMLTVIFVLSLAIAQLSANGWLSRSAAFAGLAATTLITIGLGEGLAIATGTDPGVLGLLTVVGYLAFTLWLLLTGTSLLTAPSDKTALATQPA